MAENFQALSSHVERYAILVCVPIKSHISSQKLPNSKNDLECNSYLTLESGIKSELDKARALIQYAEKCNAKLEKMYNESGAVKMFISFSSIEGMIEFRDTLNTILSKQY